MLFCLCLTNHNWHVVEGAASHTRSWFCWYVQHGNVITTLQPNITVYRHQHNVVISLLSPSHTRAVTDVSWTWISTSENSSDCCSSCSNAHGSFQHTLPRCFCSSPRASAELLLTHLSKEFWHECVPEITQGAEKSRLPLSFTAQQLLW